MTTGDLGLTQKNVFDFHKLPTRAAEAPDLTRPAMFRPERAPSLDSPRFAGEDWVITDPALIDRILDQVIAQRRKATIDGPGFSSNARFVVLRRFARELSLAQLTVSSEPYNDPVGEAQLSMPTSFGAIQFMVSSCLFENHVLLRVAKPARVLMVRRRNMIERLGHRHDLKCLDVSYAVATETLLALV